MNTIITDNEPYDHSITAFDKLAKALLLNTCLLINQRVHRICEVEVYANSPEFPDNYTHCMMEQQLWGKWYFHRYKDTFKAGVYKQGSYKNGTWKGLDLTLGNDSKYLGILIRSIYDTENSVLIEGPCRTVNHILKLYDVPDIPTFVGNNGSLSALANPRDLILLDCDNLTPEPVYHGPRIGLSDKYPEYRYLLLRYVIGSVSKGKKDLKLLPATG